MGIVTYGHFKNPWIDIAAFSLLASTGIVLGGTVLSSAKSDAYKWEESTKNFVANDPEIQELEKTVCALDQRNINLKEETRQLEVHLDDLTIATEVMNHRKIKG